MNQVLSTPWRDPGEATGQRPGLPGTGSILGAACPQPGPPGGETPSLQPAQLHGAPGGCRRGSEGWWGKWEVPGIKRLPSTPAGPRPSQFSGKKGFKSSSPRSVRTWEEPPTVFWGAILASRPPNQTSSASGGLPPLLSVLRLGASPSRPPSWSGDGRCWVGRMQSSAAGYELTWWLSTRRLPFPGDPFQPTEEGEGSGHRTLLTEGQVNTVP